MTSTAARRQGSYAKTLRSSCRYCRRRKIKCDGSSPCAACNDRRIDCIHDEQARMGRPSIRSDHVVTSPSVSLGSLLDSTFDDIFVSKVPTTGFSAAVKGYLAEHPAILDLNANDLAEQKACTPPVYYALWPQLIKDLLDTCLTKYAPALRHPHQQENRPRYLPVSLHFDVATRMTSSSSDMLASEISISVVRSVYPSWAEAHPLSPCVGIDSLLEDHPATVAVRALIICEAKELVQAGTYGDANDYLDYALHALRSQQIPIYDEEQRAPATLQILLSSCQAAILFGWRCLAHNQARFGTTYMALAGQIMGRMQALISETTKTAPQSDVVTQIQTTSSYLSLMTVWAFSQLDRSTGDGHADWTLASVHPAVTKSCMINDLMTLFCKTLLNNHPNVMSVGANAGRVAFTNVEAIASQLSAWSGSLDLDALGDETSAHRDTAEALREIVILILLGAQKDGQSANNFALICRVAISRMERLAGRKDERIDRPVFARIAFHAQTKPDDAQSRIMKTLAAYLYELIPALLEHFTHVMSEADLGAICKGMLDVQLDLVETESLRLARSQLERMKSIADGTDSRVSTVASISAGSLFTPPSESGNGSAVTTPEDASGGLDMYNLLWGYIPCIEFEDDSQKRGDQTT